MSAPPPSAPPASPFGGSFPEKFAALAQAWRAQLPQRVHEMRHWIQALRKDPSDDTSLSDLHRLLHTMAGSAGTFGMADLGLGARAAEHELDRLMDLPRRTAADFAPVADMVEALARAIEA